MQFISEDQIPEQYQSIYYELKIQLLEPGCVSKSVPDRFDECVNYVITLPDGINTRVLEIEPYRVFLSVSRFQYNVKNISDFNPIMKSILGTSSLSCDIYKEFPYDHEYDNNSVEYIFNCVDMKTYIVRFKKSIIGNKSILVKQMKFKDSI